MVPPRFGQHLISKAISCYTRRMPYTLVLLPLCVVLNNYTNIDAITTKSSEADPESCFTFCSCCGQVFRLKKT